MSQCEYTDKETRSTHQHSTVTNTIHRTTLRNNPCLVYSLFCFCIWLFIQFYIKSHLNNCRTLVLLLSFCLLLSLPVNQFEGLEERHDQKWTLTSNPSMEDSSAVFLAEPSQLCIHIQPISESHQTHSSHRSIDVWKLYWFSPGSQKLRSHSWFFSFASTFYLPLSTKLDDWDIKTKSWIYG